MFLEGPDFGRHERFQALRKISGAAKDFGLANQEHVNNPCASGGTQFLFFPEHAHPGKKLHATLVFGVAFWSILGQK